MSTKIVAMLNILLLIVLFTVLALFARHLVRQNSWHYWKATDGGSYRTNVGNKQIQKHLGDGWWDISSLDHPVPANKAGK